MGPHTVKAVYSGDINFGTYTTPAITHIVSPANATYSLTASPEPSPFGSSYTITATIAPLAANTNTPTGTVNFSIDGTLVASNVAVTATGTTGTATYIVPALLTYNANPIYAVGFHTIYAVYSGDANFHPSMMSGTHIISRNLTTASITTDITATNLSPDMTPKTAFYGQDFNVVGAVLFTGLGPPMGDYLFYDNGTLICTLPYSQAMCTSVNDNFDVGVHSFTVAYSGDATNAASSVSPAVAMTFVPDITTATVVTSGTPVYQGQSITFTTTVTGNHAAPVGPVVFSIDGTPAATVALISGSPNKTSTATFTTSTLSLGTHSITVSWPRGDALELSSPPPPAACACPYAGDPFFRSFRCPPRSR